MYRLTTPTHKFRLPMSVPPETLEWAKVSYEQEDDGEVKIVLEKDLSDLYISGQVIYYRLTQEETALFRDDIPAWVQLRCGYADLAFASQKFQVIVKAVINDDVLGGDDDGEGTL